MTIFALNPASFALRWLYVDFNSYFASVEQQLRPELRGRPVAVVPVMTDATCAIAASYEAKAFGIRTGTPVWEAKRMCPDLVCVEANHQHYVRFHHEIRAGVERHIPVSRVASIDEVACALMDNEASVARAVQIAQAIKRGLAERVGAHVRCSIGIAPNCYLAKIATDMQKPDGLVVLTADVVEARLRTLRLRDLPGVGRNMERRLNLQGIADMPTLLALSPGRMRAVWGSVWGERMWHMLRGMELPPEETTRRSVGHSHVLAPELRAPGQARYVARRLVLKAASRIRRMGFYAGRLSLSVRVDKGCRWSAEERCFRAQDSVRFMELLDGLWARQLTANGAAQLKKISVTLDELVPADSVMPQLAGIVPAAELAVRDRSQKMSVAMDRLNHKYGRDTIVLGMLPSQGRSFSGTKVAFTRIPDIEEFLE